MPRKRQDPAERHERIEERRRQILGTAAIVFARRGYHRALMREIAAEAGVAEGTIYNYFANKRDLLLALNQWITTESLPGALAQPEAGSPRSLLAAILRDRLAMLDRSRALIQAVAPELLTDLELQRQYLHQVVLPVLVQFLPIAQRTGQTSQLRRFHSSVVVPAIIGGTIAAFFANEAEDLPMERVRSREQLIAELVDFFLDGLLAHEKPVQPAAAGSCAADSQAGSDA